MTLGFTWFPWNLKRLWVRIRAYENVRGINPEHRKWIPINLLILEKQRHISNESEILKNWFWIQFNLSKLSKAKISMPINIQISVHINSNQFTSSARASWGWKFHVYSLLSGTRTVLIGDRQAISALQQQASDLSIWCHVFWLLNPFSCYLISSRSASLLALLIAFHWHRSLCHLISTHLT